MSVNNAGEATTYKNVGSTGNDNVANDADRVIPRHTVDGANAATGQQSTLINELESDKDTKTHDRATHNKQTQDFGGESRSEGNEYTQVTPEVASESHTLPGPNTKGDNQASRDSVRTQ